MSAESKQENSSGVTFDGKFEDTAQSIKEKVKNEKTLKQFNSELVDASCKYIALRVHESPCLPSRIADTYEVDKNKMLSLSRKISSELEIGIPLIGPKQYVDRFCDELELNGAKKKAKELIEDFKTNRGLSGSPISIASGAIYAATLNDCSGSVTQSQLSEIADVSEVTIRKRYRELLEAHEKSD